MHGSSFTFLALAVICLQLTTQTSAKTDGRRLDSETACVQPCESGYTCNPLLKACELDSSTVSTALSKNAPTPSSTAPKRKPCYAMCKRGFRCNHSTGHCESFDFVGAAASAIPTLISSKKVSRNDVQPEMHQIIDLNAKDSQKLVSLDSDGLVLLGTRRVSRILPAQQITLLGSKRITKPKTESLNNASLTPPKVLGFHRITAQRLPPPPRVSSKESDRIAKCEPLVLLGSHRVLRDVVVSAAPVAAAAAESSLQESRTVVLLGSRRVNRRGALQNSRFADIAKKGIFASLFPQAAGAHDRGPTVLGSKRVTRMNQVPTVLGSRRVSRNAAKSDGKDAVVAAAAGKSLNEVVLLGSRRVSRKSKQLEASRKKASMLSNTSSKGRQQVKALLSRRVSRERREVGQGFVGQSSQGFSQTSLLLGTVFIFVLWL
ncbi:hypothetical protein BDR26DRAFT_856443 [Obelidium mucronatum]|nr:hypothetical protein BDR26DRAFT_856443 [Obelidium mucronatum]